MKRSIALAAAVAVVLLLCCALAPANGAAQSWAALSKRMIDDCAKFDKSVQDMTLTMEMEIPSSEGAMKTEQVLYRKGNRFRVEATMSGMEDAGLSAGMANLKTIIIGDGTNVWIIAPMMGKSQIPTDEGKKYRGQWACDDYIPADAQIIGSETVDAHACYVLSVIDERSDIAKLWIDQKTLMLVKMEGKENGGETMTVLFSDFRKIPVIGEIPHRTDMYSGTDLISTVVVTSVEVNKGLADDLFDPNKVKVEGPDTLDKTMKQVLDTIKGQEIE